MLIHSEYGFISCPKTNQQKVSKPFKDKNNFVIVNFVIVKTKQKNNTLFTLNIYFASMVVKTMFPLPKSLDFKTA